MSARTQALLLVLFALAAAAFNGSTPGAHSGRRGGRGALFGRPCPIPVGNKPPPGSPLAIVAR
jgi:hypothetical protein